MPTERQHVRRSTPGPREAAWLAAAASTCNAPRVTTEHPLAAPGLRVVGDQQREHGSSQQSWRTMTTPAVGARGIARLTLLGLLCTCACSAPEDSDTVGTTVSRPGDARDSSKDGAEPGSADTSGDPSDGDGQNDEPRDESGTQSETSSEEPDQTGSVDGVPGGASSAESPSGVPLLPPRNEADVLPDTPAEVDPSSPAPGANSEEDGSESPGEPSGTGDDDPAAMESPTEPGTESDPDRMDDADPDTTGPVTTVIQEPAPPEDTPVNDAPLGITLRNVGDAPVYLDWRKPDILLSYELDGQQIEAWQQAGPVLECVTAEAGADCCAGAGIAVLTAFTLMPGATTQSLWLDTAFVSNADQCAPCECADPVPLPTGPITVTVCTHSEITCPDMPDGCAAASQTGPHPGAIVSGEETCLSVESSSLSVEIEVQ